MTAQKPQETGLAGRYANAAFALAEEENSLDRMSADFVALKALIAANPDLARVVHSPVFSREDKAKAMRGVLTKMGASDLTVKFVGTLAVKRRLFILLDAIRGFERLLAASRGEIEAEVTSARALSDAEHKELTAVLKAKLGREPRLHARVDPRLLGGLVVKVGSRMINSSLKTKLSGIRAAMRGTR